MCTLQLRFSRRWALNRVGMCREACAMGLLVFALGKTAVAAPADEASSCAAALTVVGTQSAVDQFRRAIARGLLADARGPACGLARVRLEPANRAWLVRLELGTKRIERQVD